MAKQTDKYSQLAYIQVTESAVGTLTFEGLSVFSNVLAQQGMLIHRVEYLPDQGVWADLDDANGEYVNFGLTGSNTLTAVALSDPEVYDFRRLITVLAGTPANVDIYDSTFVTDYTDMPGGGKLVPADRLYGFVSSNLASVSTIDIRVYFTLISMTPSDYLELAQALRVLR